LRQFKNGARIAVPKGLGFGAQHLLLVGVNAVSKGLHFIFIDFILR